MKLVPQGYAVRKRHLPMGRPESPFRGKSVVPWMCLLAVVALIIAPTSCALPTLDELEPTHARPFFMPESERERIHTLIDSESWAKDAYEDVRKKAGKRNYFLSAFLYALDGEVSQLAVARSWLLKYGKKGGDIHGAKERLADPEFFKGGQKHMQQVYYSIDPRPLLAYDYIYKGLSAEDRRIIEDGILTSARFRMRSMDRWTQTPNLVFKPTWMVALAGLVTQNEEALAWGFLRKPGSRLGGYFSAMDVMLEDGGPWAEASPYAILHKDLLLMLRMSRYLGLATGKDWLTRRSSNGGSPQGLLEYYVDSAYPIERTGYGEGQIRVATYGDAATSAEGDIFLVNPAGRGAAMHEELEAFREVSNDRRYDAFLRMIPDYKPGLTSHLLPQTDIAFPSAPSRIWPNFGLAMLRSDESPSYWTSGKAIAVLQLMSQGYSHDHRDKFSITLHGAGRLLYPDYNTTQYENPSVGWTRNTIAHNTLMVDEQDTGNATPTAVRHAFAPEVKFLATSASGVFDGVDQTRALFLTGEYLLDFFHATSLVPHTYDYLLHSLGRPQAVQPSRWQARDFGLGPRFWQVTERRGVKTDDAWALDFRIDEAATRAQERADAKVTKKKSRRRSQGQRFGAPWYEHKAAVRVRMAGSRATTVVQGRGPQDLPTLTARRADIADTVFVATHEPFSGSREPVVESVVQLARTEGAVSAKVTADSFTDYAAVGLGPQEDGLVQVQGAKVEPGTVLAFRDYGYLRVYADGRVSARGDWVGFSIPNAVGPLVLNGEPAKARVTDGYLEYGELSRPPDPPMAADTSLQLEVATSPAVLRLFGRQERRLIVTVKNSLDVDIEGELSFILPEGLAIQPQRPSFGPLAPGVATSIEVTVSAAGPPLGRHLVPLRVHVVESETGKKLGESLHRIPATVGPVIERVYRKPKPSVYRIHAQRYTTEAQMFAGLFTFLADDDGRVRLDGTPLFTISDENRLLLHEDTAHGTTWPRDNPTSLLAAAEDEIRWQAIFFGDRIMLRMDPGWTQTKRAMFHLPGNWVAPAGRPHWRTILDASAKKAITPAVAGSRTQVSAAELEFPASGWNLCFQFSPPQQVSLDAEGLRFGIAGHANENWTIGFCRPGTLERWRW